MCCRVDPQFFRHYYALLVKRLHYFKRDLKGLFFLILIPVVITLGAVMVVNVSAVLSRRLCRWFRPSCRQPC